MARRLVVHVMVRGEGSRHGEDILCLALRDTLLPQPAVRFAFDHGHARPAAQWRRLPG